MAGLGPGRGVQGMVSEGHGPRPWGAVSENTDCFSVGSFGVEWELGPRSLDLPFPGWKARAEGIPRQGWNRAISALFASTPKGSKGRTHLNTMSVEFVLAHPKGRFHCPILGQGA